MGSLVNSAGNTFKIGKEVAFGVPVAPTEALKHTGVDVQLTYETIESAAFTGSRASNGAFAVGKIGGIIYPFEADGRNLGWMLKGALGAESILPAGTGGYEHEFTMLNDTDLPSFTVESSLGGEFHYTNSGVKVNTLSLEISPKAIITGSADMIFIDQVDKASPTALTPVNTKAFTYNDTISGAVKIDDVAFGEIKSLSLLFENNMSTDDYRLGNSGKLASIPAGKHKFSGSASIAFNTDSKPLEAKLSNSEAFDLKLVIDTGIPVGDETIRLEVHIPVAQISNWKKDTGDFIYATMDFMAVGAGYTVTLFNDRALVY